MTSKLNNKGGLRADYWSRKMSSTVQSHPKESNMSSTVPQHPKEDETLSTVPQHPKDGKLSSTARRSRKEKLRFRESNGAAYQVPDNWEDLYEESSVCERTPNAKCVKEKRHALSKNAIKEKGVEVEKSKNYDKTNNSDNEKKVDYYTALQKEVSNDIALANKTGIPKSTRDKRWNKKHQNEIEFDKSMLCTWVEHGVTNWAEAPRYTKSTDEKFVDSVYDSTRKSLTPTLGDFMPKFKSKAPQKVPVMVPTLGDYIPSFRDVSGKTRSLRVVNVNGEEVKLTPNQAENFLLALKNGYSNAKSCCKAYNTSTEDEKIILTLPYDLSDESIVTFIETVSKPVDFVPVETNPGNKHSIKVLDAKGEEVKLTSVQSDHFLLALKNGNPNSKACVDALNIDTSVTSCGHYTPYSEYDEREPITLKFPCEMSVKEMTTFIEIMSKPWEVVFNDRKDKPMLTNATYTDLVVGHTALTKLTSKLISNIIEDIESLQIENKSTLTAKSYADKVKEDTLADQVFKRAREVVRERCIELAAAHDKMQLIPEQDKTYTSLGDSRFKIEDSDSDFEYEVSDRIPLCSHGLHFQVKRFNEFYFKEAERMLDNIPVELVNEFVDLVNSLNSIIDSVHFNNVKKDIFKCDNVCCRWKEDTSDEHQIKRPYEIFNSVSFEMKAVRVLSPKYRLKNLTRDECNPRGMDYCSDQMIGQKYKKALDSFEFDKRYNLSKHINNFVSQLYRETFMIVESVMLHDSKLIRKGINKLYKFVRHPDVERKFDKKEFPTLKKVYPLKSSSSEEYDDESCSMCSFCETSDTCETMIPVNKKDGLGLVNKLDAEDIKKIPESFLPMVMVENISFGNQSAETKSTSDNDNEVDKTNIE